MTSPVSTYTRHVLLVVVAGLLSLGSTRGEAQGCPSDCDGDGTITITELAVGARVLLEHLATVADCPAGDVNGDAAITVDEAVAATSAALGGCGSPPPAAGVSGVGANPVIELSAATGAAGTQVVVTSTLHTSGQLIAGTQQDIAFDALTPITSCAANPAIDKGATGFGFQPSGCTPGVDCVAVRALVLSFSNVDPIPDGSVLFSCTIDISPAAPEGVYPLVNSNLLSATPAGDPVATDGIDGAVIVSGAVTPPPTNTATPTPVTAPASVILEKVCLRADTARSAHRHNGSVRVRGLVNANAPFAGFVEDILASGVMVHVSGAGGVDVVLAWQASGCSVRDTSRGPRVQCVVGDASDKRKADFRPIRPPNLFRTTISAYRLDDFSPPLTTDPVTVVITTTSFQREDTIGGCKVRRAGKVATCKEAGFVPTFTPSFTPTSTPTDTPTPPDGTTIVVGDALGVPGGTAQFTVGLETNAAVAGTENEIQFGVSAPLAFTDCRIDPGMDKSLFFALRPTNCVPGTDCTAMKGLVLSFANLDPIPNGSTMYSCDVLIFQTAALGDYLIDCFNPGASDPVGNAIPTECSDGTMTVVPGSP